MSKVLTIVIPTYNMEKLLDKCLSSLVISNKNMSQIEVLVVNDGSKDTSSAIAHVYENKYPQVFRVIDKENGNYGSCVNCGLKEAQGKYIKILDADDWLNTKNLDAFIVYLASNDSDLILSDYNKVREDGSIISFESFNVPSYQTLRYIDYCNMPTIMSIQMHAVTYKTSILKDINYHQTEGISYTDQEWIFIPMNYVETFSYFNNVVYQYFIGRSGQTMEASVFHKSMKQFTTMVFSLIDSYNKHTITTIQINEYLQDKICKNIKIVYKNFLLDRTNNLSALEEFDSELRKQNDIYVITENIIIHKTLPFKMIKYYRQNKKHLPWCIYAIYKIKMKWSEYKRRSNCKHSRIGY